MEIQCARLQTLPLTRSIPLSPYPTSSKFNLQTTITQQPKCCIKALLSETAQGLRWSIGSCKIQSSGKLRAFTGQDFKGSTRLQGPCFATRNSDKPVPEEDNPEGKSESNSPGSEDAGEQVHLSHIDWRAFRAKLVAAEQVQKTGNGESGSGKESSIELGPKWAHPIHAPESGCLLVATEKLDGTRSFERTVVLLLRAGSNDPREGAFGVILNRPLQRCIRDTEPTNPDLATIFADCPLHFGGPLEASMFLLTTGKNVVTDFDEVIPGLCYGARNSLHSAAELVRNEVLQPQNFRFFLGYAGWELDQLKEELSLDYWYVAACSPNLITAASSSSSGLWEEILQLMGGRYAELSRKPKEDSI
jgi:putative transcriptional regulator